MNPRESSIDIYALIGKFREKVVGAFVKKVYDLGNDTIALQIHGPTAKFDMVISKRLGIYFGDEEKPAEASPFAMLLRKMLSERRIADLGQINFDRVVRMAFSSGQELILELFREGNIIITNGGVIEFASNPREWRNRKILKGEKYIPPSAVDPLAIADDEFLSIIRTSKGSPVQTIATRLNFGGELAEEVVERSGLKAVATA
ncbi:NFACT family protein, partial [Thermoplasmatales archaeon AK]|nr:NFACT family protein [Thermoplasmatales archaeon AK]